MNEQTEHSSCQVVRSSIRVLRKKTSRSVSEGAEVIENDVSGNLVVPDEGGSSIRTRRTWEQWSLQDKSTFFEAIKDLGKNFDHVQKYFQNKAKKKDMPGHTLKTKQQIRTFYYRTWHKIIAHVDFPDGLNKSACELYGLINYGELRKKIGGGVLDERNGVKLKELVFRGSTTLKVKGKSFRIRTPMCRALIRISNRIDSSINHRISTLSTFKPSSSSECVDHHSQSDQSVTELNSSGDQPKKVPSKVTIHLKPATNDDLWRVHVLSMQNPHLAVSLDVDRKLSFLIHFLENKWHPADEKRLTSIKQSVSGTKCEGNDSSLPRYELWVSSMPEVDVCKPIFTPIEAVTSSSISLSKLQEKLEKAGKFRFAPDHEEISSPLLHMPSSVNLNKNERILEGWNKNTHLSIGELYLMLHQTSNQNRINLQYTWKQVCGVENQGSSMVTMSALARYARHQLMQRISVRSSSTSNTATVTRDQTLPSSGVVFKKPLAAPSVTPSQEAFREQLRMLLPKFSHRKGRPLSRKNVVNRRIGTQIPANRNMMLLLPPSSKTTAETSGDPLTTCQRIVLAPNTQETVTLTHPLIKIQPTPVAVASSPLAKVSLLPPVSNSREDTSSLPLHDFTPHFSVGNNDPTVLNTPTRSLSEDSQDAMWTPPLPELSLSSLIGFGNSPLKSTTPVKSTGFRFISEDSSQSTSSEVDRQFISMMNEDSFDFTSKFAHLASHVIESELETDSMLSHVTHDSIQY